MLCEGEASLEGHTAILSRQLLQLAGIKDFGNTGLSFLEDEALAVFGVLYQCFLDLARRGRILHFNRSNDRSDLCREGLGAVFKRIHPCRGDQTVSN